MDYSSGFDKTLPGYYMYSWECPQVDLEGIGVWGETKQVEVLPYTYIVNHIVLSVSAFVGHPASPMMR